MRAPLALLVGALLLAGCTNGEEDGPRHQGQTVVPFDPGEPTPATSGAPPTTPVAPSVPAATRTLTVRELHAGSDARVQEEGRLVLVDQGAWTTWWASLRGPDAGEPPAVDFARESVLVALHGPAPDACHAIRITGASLVSREVNANVTTFLPGAGQACAEVFTFPWHAVAVDHPDAVAAWNERDATGPPPP